MKIWAEASEVWAHMPMPVYLAPPALVGVLSSCAKVAAGVEEVAGTILTCPPIVSVPLGVVTVEVMTPGRTPVASALPTTPWLLMEMLPVSEEVKELDKEEELVTEKPARKLLVAPFMVWVPERSPELTITDALLGEADEALKLPVAVWLK